MECLANVQNVRAAAHRMLAARVRKSSHQNTAARPWTVRNGLSRLSVRCRTRAIRCGVWQPSWPSGRWKRLAVVIGTHRQWRWWYSDSPLETWLMSSWSPSVRLLLQTWGEVSRGEGGRWRTLPRMERPWLDRGVAFNDTRDFDIEWARQPVRCDKNRGGPTWGVIAGGSIHAAHTTKTGDFLYLHIRGPYLRGA